MAQVDFFAELKYTIDPEKVEVLSTNMNDEGVKELLENFVLGEVGRGKDKSVANEKDAYTITLGLRLEDDAIFVKDDCGNKGLRLGVLARCMALLG